MNFDQSRGQTNDREFINTHLVSRLQYFEDRVISNIADFKFPFSFDVNKFTSYVAFFSTSSKSDLFTHLESKDTKFFFVWFFCTNVDAYIVCFR